jgi:CheY-like chemotaxis protein
MDVQMPELDGLETTRRIRREFPEFQQPQVIAMTANAMQGDREMCLAAGMDDYVSKPIRVEALVDALSHSQPLNESQTAAAGAPQDGGVHDMPAAEAQVPSLTASENSEPVLDQKALQNLYELVGEEFGFLVELFDSFLEEAPALLAEMDGYIQEGDPEGVRRMAHSLKSNSADLGATKLHQLNKDLEQSAKMGNLEQAAAIHQKLVAEFQVVKAALENVRQEGRLDV